MPEPDGPISPRYSPSATVMVTRSSTGISTVSRLYALVTSRSSISAIYFALMRTSAPSVRPAGAFRITLSPGSAPLVTST